MKSYPKISIVTPSYNQADFIEETILSIISQNYPNLEYIIIDGGSTDGSVEIIKKYEKHLKYWISEPDKGQWDAILKGLAHCTGELFNWINSDDLLVAGSLDNIASGYSTDACVAGNIECFSNTNKFLMENKNLGYTELVLNKAYFNQQGFWFNLKNLQELLKNYPFQQFHYSFDRILTTEYLKEFPQISYVTTKHLGRFRIHEESKTNNNWYKFDQELYEYYTLQKDVFLKNKMVNLKELKKLTYQYLVQANVNFCNTNKSFFSKKIALFTLIFKYPGFILNRYYLGALKKSK